MHSVGILALGHEGGKLFRYCFHRVGDLAASFTGLERYA